MSVDNKLKSFRRLFFAIEIPNENVETISAFIDGSKISTGRYVHPENFHITVKYLANVELGDPVERLLSETTDFFLNEKILPFNLFLNSIIVFPNHENPKILSIGVDGDLEIIRELERKLSSKLKWLNLPDRTRLFRPHLTIARIFSSKGKGEIARMARSCKERSFGKLDVESISLFESTLTPDRPIYTKVKQFDFKNVLKGNQP